MSFLRVLMLARNKSRSLKGTECRECLAETIVANIARSMLATRSTQIETEHTSARGMENSR